MALEEMLQCLLVARPGEGKEINDRINVFLSRGVVGDADSLANDTSGALQRVADAHSITER